MDIQELLQQAEKLYKGTATKDLPSNSIQAIALGSIAASLLVIATKMAEK